jgi:hypothetical protein
MQTASSSDEPLQLEASKRRRTTYMPRFPLVLAQEVGSYLPRYPLRECLTLVCSSGLSFLSAPATGLRTAVLQLYILIRSCYEAVCAPTTSGGLNNAPTSTVDPKVGEMVVERIASLLKRRSHIQRLVLKVDRWAANYLRDCGPVVAHVCQKLSQVGSEEAMVQGRNVAIEWDLYAKTIKSLAPFRALRRLNFVRANVKNFPGLASCRTLHTVDISYSKIVNLAPLASCQALHTLNISGSKVVDVSVLASCKELRNVELSNTNISDVAALASCPELREVFLDNTRVSDVSALGSCRYLETLSVSRTHVSDVSVFASSQTLRGLIIGSTSVTEVSALVDCVSLRTLWCWNSPKPSGYAEVQRSINARVLAARKGRC